MSVNSSSSELIRKIASSHFEELYEVLASLEIKQWRAIDMRFWQQMTIDQIATALHLSWDDANRLIENTLTELKKTIEDKMELESADHAA
jgi:DNA-directed RNA polymerase specialized sigma24 family protein